MQRSSSVGAALLLVTAVIWGLAFVAQRAGMQHVGPFTFNAIRFALGVVTLLPLLPLTRGNRRRVTAGRTVRFGLATGVVLFGGASLQQIGIVFTTAGNAGFITGLYLVMVPLLGILRRQRVGAVRWMAVGLATLGMYLLSVTPGTAVNPGDLLVLASALFFALHVQMIDHGARHLDALLLSVVQYAVVALGSAVTARAIETVSTASLAAAAPAILYGGIGSISIAYTLQVYGQRSVEPSHAAIILSLEGAFAVLGGWLVLSEVLSARALAGCLLMLSAMLLSQLWPRRQGGRAATRPTLPQPAAGGGIPAEIAD
ncbi:MAG: DMT family transporter [Spirochaetaceae bacterium]|nr:MAG: DMT family transporter [Spirochaetaceae bacterium]